MSEPIFSLASKGEIAGAISRALAMGHAMIEIHRREHPSRWRGRAGHRMYSNVHSRQQPIGIPMPAAGTTPGRAENAR